METAPSIDANILTSYVASPAAVPELAEELLRSLERRGWAEARGTFDALLYLLRTRHELRRIGGLRAWIDGPRGETLWLAAYWTTRWAEVELNMFGHDEVSDRVRGEFQRLDDRCTWYAVPAWDAYRQYDEDRYLRACGWSVGRAWRLLRERGYMAPAVPPREPEPYTPALVLWLGPLAMVMYNNTRWLCFQRGYL